jgi:hypothetical protein
MATIRDVWAAFAAGRGCWSGCNWPTRYGSLGLDLDGVSAIQAHQAASRWLALAVDEGYEDATPREEAELRDMARQLRLAGARGCRGEGGRAYLSRRLCAERLAREWKLAAYVLAAIEQDARRAEEAAREAAQAAEDGDWEAASRHARCACWIESGYLAPRAWRRLRRVIASAARQDGAR